MGSSHPSNSSSTSDGLTSDLEPGACDKVRVSLGVTKKKGFEIVGSLSERGIRAFDRARSGTVAGVKGLRIWDERDERLDLCTRWNRKRSGARSLAGYFETVDLLVGRSISANFRRRLLPCPPLPISLTRLW